MFSERLFRELGRQKVKYLVVGLEDFSDKSKREDWISNKNMKAFKLYGVENPAEHLDIVIDSGVDFDRAYPNRTVIKAGDLRIPLIGIDDLIRMKKKAGRRKDEIDIEALNRIKKLRHD